MNIPFLTSLSVLSGITYFYIMESSIDTDVNCSYSASITTDVLAFIVGGVIMQKGYTGHDPLLYLLGSSIVVEHIMQAVSHKL